MYKRGWGGGLGEFGTGVWKIWGSLRQRINVEGLRGGQVRSVRDEFLIREVWRHRIQDGERNLGVEGVIGDNRL